MNHKDGNKHNNSADNLEIITSAENTKHAWALGLSNKELNPNRVVTDVYDHIDGRQYSFLSLSDVCRQFSDLSMSYIRRIKNNKFSFSDLLFVKINTGRGQTDYRVKCFHNGILIHTFRNNEEAGKYFGKSKNLISSRYKHEASKIKNRYTITFPNVSTIESTNNKTIGS